MTDYRRRKYPGGYYFFTVITHDRRPLFVHEGARACLRQAWVQTHAKRPFKTIALCLMPDHLHCVWKLPDNDFNYSCRWASIKSGFTRLWLLIGGQQADQSPSRIKKRERASGSDGFGNIKSEIGMIWKIMCDISTPILSSMAWWSIHSNGRGVRGTDITRGAFIRRSQRV